MACSECQIHERELKNAIAAHKAVTKLIEKCRIPDDHAAERREKERLHGELDSRYKAFEMSQALLNLHRKECPDYKRRDR